ncbi:uncharacterized protein LOC141679965 [Apium graveolens]|uniref:uncharacterized protein LOC141679965 n=1 Tax=Apium graveolens TaxID=4045 RepID=UPI003D792760
MVFIGPRRTCCYHLGLNLNLAAMIGISNRFCGRNICSYINSTSSFCREKNKLKYQKLEPPSLDQVKPSAELELSENGAEVEDQQTESSPLEQAWLKAGSVDAQSGLLPQVEVDALCDIGDQLGKNDWNFNGNPCDQNWRTEKSSEKPGYNNSVICGFSYPDGICHVECIILKGQNLDGILPPSLAKLPYIKDIDLTNNYLHGTIPREWTSLRLNYLMFSSNSLTGMFPTSFAMFKSINWSIKSQASLKCHVKKSCNFN